MVDRPGRPAAQLFGLLSLGVSLLTAAASAACTPRTVHDLAISNVRVFDSRSGTVTPGRTVLVDGDSITAVLDATASADIRADSILDGRGRLLVPGFIDTHVHLRQVLRTGEVMPAAPDADSLTAYRERLGRAFLPHGVTTVVDMGQPEAWMDVTLSWQRGASPDMPNVFTTGGALISDLDWDANPPPHHVKVAGPEAAAAKVNEYADRGVRHVKLYWKLEREEMAAAVAAVADRGLRAYAHTDNNFVTIPTALSLGVRHFEHVFTLIPSVLDLRAQSPALEARYGIGRAQNIDEMGGEGASLSTALDVLASAAGVPDAAFCSFDGWPRRTAPELSYDADVRRRLRGAFGALMEYVRLAHEAGVQLRVGTDCELGGRALLAELILLREAGIPMEDVLRIATLNGARALGIDDRYGAIEPGMKADMVLFETDPLDDPRGLRADKLVIKGGQVVAGR